jgi:CRP-like cAMP-binding protein
MKTLIPLRVVAILGNILFLSYGLTVELWNITALHAALLPLNLLRLFQALALRKRLREMAHAQFDPGALIPFMTQVDYKGGSYLFERGDQALDIYYLLEGRVRVEALDLAIYPGQLIGEIAMFTPEKSRTQTVVCETNCKLLKLSEDKTLQLYAENPEFGLYITKMMVSRLLDNSKSEGGPAAVTEAPVSIA